MRHFKDQIFLGSGEHSQRKIDLLKEQLEKALTILGGLQQPMMSTEKPIPEVAQEVADEQREYAEIVADIHTALTGKSIPVDVEVQISPPDYIAKVLVTESVDMPKIAERLQDPRMIRLLHGMMGLTTETGEFADQLKKHIFYGKEMDEINLMEEIGDLLWYVGILLDELGFSFEEVMERNIAKLQARYKGAFTETRAIGRDLDIERQTLEKDR
jgi:NTP pyrophosphatase (non-canonical NTP hydrolase)